MTLQHAQVVDRLRWLIDSVELQLIRLPDGASVGVETVRESGARRLPTLNETMLVPLQETELDKSEGMASCLSNDHPRW